MAPIDTKEAPRRRSPTSDKRISSTFGDLAEGARFNDTQVEVGPA
jgi:hypothetical protein